MLHFNQILRRAVLPVLTALAGSSVYAQYSTGFESPTFTNGSTASGLDGWSTNYGTAGTKLVSTANPYSGSQHLRLTDSTTGAESIIKNVGAINVTQPFTVSFAFAVSGVSDGTGAQAQILFGTTNSLVGSSPYWFNVFYDDSSADTLANGSLFIGTNSASGLSVSNINLGAFTTYAPIGSYVSFSITIDPTTFKYTSVTITGATSGLVDKTSVVQTGGSLGTVPHLSTAASSVPTDFTVLTGGNDTLTLDFDAFSFSQVPEPSTYAALAGIVSLGFVIRRRRSPR